MTESTIIALAILVLVFFTIAITILKVGVDAAIRLWSVMGALTGVAFGAITTYYFTDQVRKREVAELTTRADSLETALTQATIKAADAKTLVSPFYSALAGTTAASFELPVIEKAAATIPAAERNALAERLQHTTKLLEQIQELQAAGPTSATSVQPKK